MGKWIHLLSWLLIWPTLFANDPDLRADLVQRRQAVMEKTGATLLTTNNQMELQALIEGLQSLQRPTRVHVVTDSNYLKQGLTEWIQNWKRRGWKRKTSNGLKPVKNVEQWKQLDALTQMHKLSFELVRGHVGHPENERCDELAVNAYKDLMEQ